MNLKANVKMCIKVDVQIQVLRLVDKNPKEAKQGGLYGKFKISS